jgi:hypothetical protein
MNTDFKFDREIAPGRKQKFFSQDDDYYVYRKHMFEFAENICCFLKNNNTLKVLEVGPSSKLYVEEEFPQFSTSIIEETCARNNIYYRTLDIDQSSKADYIGSIEDLSFMTETFDIVILIGIIEHVPKVFLVPQELYKITNDNSLLFVNTPYMFKIHGPIPDCWRFSEYGYKALFGDLFSIQNIDAFPPNELGKNSIPLSLNVILKKNNGILLP